MSNMGSFSDAFGMNNLSFAHFTDYFSIECGNVMGLGGAVFAAITGVLMLSKEEKEHTAEFLFTHPLSRSRIVLEKLLALADRFGVSLDYLMDRVSQDKAPAGNAADSSSAGIPADPPSPEILSYVPKQGDDPLNFDEDPERETPEAKHNRLLLAIALVCIAAVVLLFLSGLK